MRNGLRPRPDVPDIPGRDGKDGKDGRGAAYEQQTTKNTLLL